MRRSIWIGAGIIVALALAVPLWLVLDDGGVRRLGAVAANPNAANGRVGRFTIAGINGGNPTPLDGFGAEIRRAPGAAQPNHEVITLLRSVDDLSVSFMSMMTRGTKAATARIELVSARTGSNVVFAVLDLTNVSVDAYTDADANANEKGFERITLGYDTLTLRLPQGGEPPPATGDDALTVPSISADPAGIESFTLEIEKGAPGSGVKIAFPPVRVTFDEVNTLMPGLMERAVSGATAGKVIGRMGEIPDFDYATFELTAASVLAFELASTRNGLVSGTAEFSYTRVSMATKYKTAGGDIVSGGQYCWDLALVRAC